MDLSTLSALTWVSLIAAAALTGLAKTAVPGLASVAAAIFALVLPAKESTGVMLALLLIATRRPVGVRARREHGSPETPRSIGARRRGTRSAPAGSEHAGSDAPRNRCDPPAHRHRHPRPASRGPPRVSQGRVARAVYGTLANFTTMAANAGGPVPSMYFLASRFSVTEFLGTTAWFFFTVNIIKAPLTIGMRLLRHEHLPLIGMLAPVVLACAWAGRRLAAHIPLRVFEPLVITTTIVATVPLIL